MFVVQVGFAQKTVSGTVTDENEAPLPGVNITVEGATTGTNTDFDGNYEIEVEEGQVLQFTTVGFEDQSVTVGEDDTIDVQLSEGTALDEVVVTALGIKREKKAIGYAAQDISGDKISQSGQVDAVGALSGNVAGLQMTSPSTMGGSNRMTIRGISSITGENRPLIIVDGVPLDNSNDNSTATQRGGGGRDYGDASFDINPDDIEDVTVLKGGPASALYGSRAANGAILYTTKSAKEGKTTVEYNTGLTFESIYKYPNLQREYGGGSGDELSQTTIDGKTYNIPQFQVDESWGPKYDSNIKYLPWYSLDPEFGDDYLQEVPWVAPEHDVDYFFDTGINYKNNFSISKSFENTNLRFSYTNNSIEGIVPTSKINKNNFSLNADSELSDRLSAKTTINYATNKGHNRPVLGYGDGSFGQQFFQWTQRQLDYKKLRDYKAPDGSQRTWNRTAWDDPEPAFTGNNPYWDVNENWSKDQRNRIYGTAGLTFDFTENLYATGTVNADYYTFNQQSVVAVGSGGTPSFETSKRTRSEYNYELRLHYDNKFGDFNLNSFVGLNRRQNKASAVSGSTVGGLVIPDFYNLDNSVENSTSTNKESSSRVNSVYGMVSLGYKDIFYLEGTGRNDWFSTVASSSFYPSVTGSFLFSNIIDSADWLSFGKLRLGWATIGNDTGPYQTIDYVNSESPFQGDPRYSMSNQKANADLKPEKKITNEIGLEMDFLDNRLGFDLTYYDIDVRDLILPLQVDYSTGFYYNVINGGKMNNKGLELTLHGTPVETEDFSWNLEVNFSKNKNEIKELGYNLENYLITDAPFQAQLNAPVGESYASIFGTDYVYDDDGNKVVGENGLYEASEIKNLGSTLPDWNMGIRTSFNYKNLSLSALFDIQHGGKYFSVSHMFGMYSGMLEETVANNVREDGLVVPGVTADGNENETRVDGQAWAESFYGGVDAQSVFDASYIKLRDISLSYDLPNNLIEKTPLDRVRLSVFGRNLLAWNLDWEGMDPENTSYGSGNIQGLEGGSLPSTRQYGFNVSFTF